MQPLRATPGAELVPVDSEHCAIHQCLRSSAAPDREVARLLLTASGGPFRGRTADRAGGGHASRQALAHPTWSMGPKITIDSSTLMNKGLEVIEAHELFGVDYDRIEVVVHPQSIIHSMVEFSDGSTIAQLSMPDMRLPIGYALAFPERIGTPFGAHRLAAARPARLRAARPRHVPLPRTSPTQPDAPAAALRPGSAPPTRSPSRRSSTARIRWEQIADVCKAALDRHDLGVPTTVTRSWLPTRPTASWRATSLAELIEDDATGEDERCHRQPGIDAAGRYDRFRNEVDGRRVGHRAARDRGGRRAPGSRCRARSPASSSSACWRGWPFTNIWMFVFVVGIIVSVFLHETGHFVTARLTGMKATQFFLGFGPRLWSFRRGETEYGVRPCRSARSCGSSA